jgi:hypothetical protein
MSDEVVVWRRSWFDRAFLSMCALVSAVFVAQWVLVDPPSGTGSRVFEAAFGLIIVAFFWTTAFVSWRSFVRLDSERLRLRNAIRVFDIARADITGARFGRWGGLGGGGLVIDALDGAYECWAVPRIRLFDRTARRRLAYVERLAEASPSTAPDAPG